MSKQIHFGKCALCGCEGPLTFEHIPPKSALNQYPAKAYSANDVLNRHDKMPWDYSGLKYTDMQRGVGAYTLCKNCNNQTGEWYGNDYKSVILQLYGALNDLKGKEQNKYKIRINNFHGLRFIKQVFSMFCSINNFDANPIINKEFDPSGYPPFLKRICDYQIALNNALVVIDDLRRFVLNKELHGIDKSVFKLCMYLTQDSIPKQDAISVKMDNDSISILSEISTFPVGFILYFFPSSGDTNIGVDITPLADYTYDDLIIMELPYKTYQTNIFLPEDFRTKDEIIQTIENNRKWIKEHEPDENI